MAVIDSRYFLGTVVNAIRENLLSLNRGEFLLSALDGDSGILKTLEKTEINDYAYEIDAVLKDRESYYMGSIEEVSRKMNEVQYALNLNMEFVSTAPVKESLETFYLIGILLR